MNFSEDFGDCPSSDELIPEHWEAEQVKTRYFDIHVSNGPKNTEFSDGFSVFMKIDNIGVWEKEDIIAIAIDKDKLDLDDAAYVDYVEEIDENEFLEATSESPNHWGNKNWLLNPDDDGDIGVGGLIVKTKKEFLEKYKNLCKEYGFCVDDGISNNPEDLTINNVTTIK